MPALIFSSISLVGIFAYLVVFAALHVLPTGYQPIRHAVSDYAVGGYGHVFKAGLWLSSAGVLALAIALALKPGAPPLAESQLVFLFVVPFTRVGMAYFPTDLEGQKLTRNGRLHYLFAVASFAFTYAAIAGMTPRLGALPGWQPVAGLLGVLHWIVLIALILLVVTLIPRLRRIFGLFERAFLVSTNVWFVVVAVSLLVHSS
jgi:hypothetical protein